MRIIEVDHENVVKKALAFAKEAHESVGQVRKYTGEPYIVHPMEVADIVKSVGGSEAMQAAALLHDTVEDTDATLDELKDDFGNDVADLVDGVSKISGIEFSSRKEKQVGNFMKMLLSVAKDLRVIIIKFADRLHNMAVSYTHLTLPTILLV